MFARGSPVEFVSCYKYLCILIDENLILKNIRTSKLGSFYKNKSCFSFNIKKWPVAATFLTHIDYGDITYVNAHVTSLQMLEAVYHGALRFNTGRKTLTHHCTIHSLVNWPSLFTRRLFHWYIFIYKSVIGLLPVYLTSLKRETTASTQKFNKFTVPSVCTELRGEKIFSYNACYTWNK